MDTSCGLSEAPILIESQPGQTINITLTDFNWKGMAFLGPKCPQTYGHLVSPDSEDILNICGGSDRVKHVHVSTSHQVQMMLLPAAASQFRFLLKIEGKILTR
jgi:hypothetical protein